MMADDISCAMVERSPNCCRSKGRAYRYFAMFNICCISLSVIMNTDSVGSYQESVIKAFNISYTEFSFMVSVGSWSSLILSPIEGMIVDRIFGAKLGEWIYLTIFILGAYLIGIGVLTVKTWCTAAGMFISGLGMSGLFVCLQIFCVQYFKGKELSLMISSMVSITKLGSSAMYAMAQPLLAHVKTHYSDSLNGSTGISLLIVDGYLLLPIISLVFLSFMNPKEEVPKQIENKFKWKTIKINYFITSIFELPPQYWLLQFVSGCFAASIYVMIPFEQGFFSTAFNMTIDSANLVISYSSIFAALVSPLVGMAVDRTGRELYILFLGLILGSLAHLLLAFTRITPYLAMFILSSSFAIYSATVNPLMPLIVPENKLGIAFGIGISVIGGVFSLHTYLLGLIIDNHGYVVMEIFLAAHGIFGLLVLCILFWKDKGSNGILNMASTKRKLFLSDEIENEEANEPLKNKTNSAEFVNNI